MIQLTRATKPSDRVDTTLTLPYDDRVKSRLRVMLDDGSEAGVFLERGDSLRDGDWLQGSDGRLVRVKAAEEAVSSCYSDDPLQLARACYHLGNRHVPLQIEAGRLRYRHDHVLDAMVQGLGLEVQLDHAPFEPESGAYGHGGGQHH